MEEWPQAHHSSNQGHGNCPPCSDQDILEVVRPVGLNSFADLHPFPELSSNSY